MRYSLSFQDEMWATERRKWIEDYDGKVDIRAMLGKMQSRKRETPPGMQDYDA